MKNTFTITVDSVGKVTLSEDIYFNKFESGVTELVFTWPTAYTGYAYLLARSYTHKREYFAIPLVNKKVTVGSTITQFDGPWAFNFAVMSDPIGSGKADSVVFMSDVFKGLVYDNITSPDTPNATEPNVLKICNDVKYLYDLFQTEMLSDREARQQAREKLNADYVADKASLDGITETVQESATAAEESATEAAEAVETVESLKDAAATSAASANNSARSAANAKSDAIEAKNVAYSSAIDAVDAADTALTYKVAAAASASSAAADKDLAGEYKDIAVSNGTLAKSYAVGGTATRDQEETSNAKYYYNQVKEIAENIEGGMIPMGTIPFSDLESQLKATGFMYNISTAFTSTSNFKDGGGIKYPAGTNVYYTADSMWDCLAGKPIVVDDDLSTSSENPVQNKVVKSALDYKQDVLDTQTAYSAKGSATKVPQITTNNLGQVTAITEVDITDTGANAVDFDEATRTLSIKKDSSVLDTCEIPGGADIVTSWEPTLSDEKVASEKLVKDSLDGKMDFVRLANVATSGSYNDLSDKPTIDSKLSSTSTKAVQNSTITKVIGNDEYSSSKTYAVGNLCIYNNNLYKCKLGCTNIAPTNTTYWETTNITSEVGELNSNLNLLRYPSTTERVVGEYNGKTIYETTFTGDMSSTSTGGSAYFKKITTLGTSAVLMSVSGSVKRSDGNNITLGTYLTDTSRAFVNLTGSGDLRVTVGNDYNGSNVTYIATVRYTK